MVKQFDLYAASGQLSPQGRQGSMAHGYLGSRDHLALKDLCYAFFCCCFFDE